MSSTIAMALMNGTSTSRAAGANGPAQSRNHSVIMAALVLGTAPAWIIRKTATSCDSLVSPPQASVTTQTSKPAFSASTVGYATHTSVTTPPTTSRLRPVFFTASTN